MTNPTPDHEAPPTVPPVVRTIAYAVGPFAGAAVAPLALADLPIAAAAAGALAGACSALAFGYRPTRNE